MRIIAGVLFVFAAAISTASAQDAAGTPPASSQSTDIKINGSMVIRTAAGRTPEQEKADAEARIAWNTRCRPSVVEDREGIRRTQYAEPDCDLSRFNTAGN